MALFKCKMCGGTLEITENASVATCEYCGTKQTIPKLDNDVRTSMYDRASHFRRNNDFDKAMAIYEQILNTDGTDAEAYWSIVLCRYGIEYVEDPGTKTRIPTVNRAQFTSIFDDEDYKSAIKNADEAQRAIYEAEAKTINNIQKGILSISQKEEPFDVFICYKETDANGRRTQDSVLAQELYYELKNEGFKVFFSRITLEDKLGSAYEPYIFAALNSAKVMVVVGTRPEYFGAVWVRNEWSRFLALIKNGAKKTLVPAYRGMDPYDLPDEFSHLQALDMSKLGFMQDLVRGIKKIIGTSSKRNSRPEESYVQETQADTSSASVVALVKRIHLFMEEGDTEKAEEYCEKVLDIEPENADAYIVKLLLELKLSSIEDLGRSYVSFEDNINFKRAMRYGNESQKEALSLALKEQEQRRIERNRLIEEERRKAEEKRKAEERLKAEAEERRKAEQAERQSSRHEGIYVQAIEMMEAEQYEAAICLFNEIEDYKNSKQLAEVCSKNLSIENKKDSIYTKIFIGVCAAAVLILLFFAIAFA